MSVALIISALLPRMHSGG